MQFALICAFTCILFAAVFGLDNGIRITLEYFELQFTNDKYVEINASTIQVNNKTKKVRATGLIRYAPSDNIEINISAFKILKNNKEYLFTRVKRKIKPLVFLTAIPATEELLEHFSPKLAWPVLPNVTYTLRDWWFPHSRIPTEIPMRVPTGRYKGVGTIQYPNGTILVIFHSIANVFQSYETFD